MPGWRAGDSAAWPPPDHRWALGAHARHRRMTTTRRASVRARRRQADGTSWRRASHEFLTGRARSPRTPCPGPSPSRPLSRKLRVPFAAGTKPVSPRVFTGWARAGLMSPRAEPGSRSMASWPRDDAHRAPVPPGWTAHPGALRMVDPPTSANAGSGEQWCCTARALPGAQVRPISSLHPSWAPRCGPTSLEEDPC